MEMRPHAVESENKELWFTKHDSNGARAHRKCGGE